MRSGWASRLAVAACFLRCAPCFGQGGRVAESKALQWFVYSGDHPVTGRWGVHLEGQARRTGPLTHWQQLIFRPAVNVALRPNVKAGLGYAYSRTYLDVDPTEPLTYPEHRLYQQVSLDQTAGSFRFRHRFRLEQRFMGGDTAWRYQNRFRYAIQAEYPLTARNYLRLLSESHVRFGAGGGRAFDQQRGYVGVGRRVSPYWRVEAGYLHQYIVPRTGPVYKHNHVFKFSVLSRLPFRRGER